MLGRQSPQRDLFGSDSLYLEHVGRDTFYGFLAENGHSLFPDDDYKGLYREGWGRPGVPPSQLCVALILQAKDRVSDDEAIQRSAYDMRWKVALGLGLGNKLCAKSTLQVFRAKLVLHDMYGELFEKSVQACRSAGLMKRRKLEVAIDTTPVLGRGAVKDTYNLVSDQIRAVVGEVVKLKGWELEGVIEEHGLGRHFGKSFKGSVELEWSDPEQRRALVAQLVADAKVTLEVAKAALRGYRRDSAKARSLREARDLLADLLLQDIEETPEDGAGPQIRKGNTRDRVVSTTDPEMRHGHKSHSYGFCGYKASVVAETESGVILATDVRAGNVHDGKGAARLVEQAGEAAQMDVARALGDTAYGLLDTRKQLEEVADEVYAKAPPVSANGNRFTVNDFKLDKRRGVMTCPAGKKSIGRKRVAKPPGTRYVFSRADCQACPLRADCTKSKSGARVVSITEVTEKQQANRRKQLTKRFRRAYRRRVVVEHRISRLVQLGIRQARYFGKAKTAFQVAIAAAAANLMAAAAAGAWEALLAALRTLFRASTWLEVGPCLDSVALQRTLPASTRRHCSASTAPLGADLAPSRPAL